jgi:type IV fimbrial biogenesis protein FimT
MHRRARGFTLVELMVVLVVVGVLATLAAPSFNRTIESERVKSAATDLYIALSRARSEAITRNTDVTLSPVSGNWALGWQIPDPASTGTLIETHEALKGNLAIAPSATGSVVYRSSGRVQGTANMNFSIAGTYATSARCVCLDLSGRPAIVAGACTSTSC